MGGQLPTPVVADVDEEVEPVAVPLDADPVRLALIHEREHGAPHDGARGVRDLAGECPARRGRLDELYVEIAVTDEGPQVVPEPGEGADDGFDEAVPELVARRAEIHERPGREFGRHRARGAVVEATGAEYREDRFERHRVPIRLVGRELEGVDGHGPTIRSTHPILSGRWTCSNGGASVVDAALRMEE